MKAFSVRNDKTYTKEYYKLLYDIFFTETKDEAMKQAKQSLSVSGLSGDFGLEELGKNYYHLADNGKLEPFRTCTYSPSGWGIVYRCLDCGEEIDDSQSELLVLR